MGNSTGMILPKPILVELGVGTGAAMDIVVENGRVIATPIRRKPREGWEDAAKLIANEPDPEAEEWRGFGTDFDAEWQW